MCSAPSKDWFDYLVTAIPMVISFAVAVVGLGQYRIAREKLRLDLYNRRFEIYVSTMIFYQSLLGSEISLDRPSFDEKQRAFIKASREARFLFDRKSGVQAILEDFHRMSFKIIFHKSGGFAKIASSRDPQAFQKENDEFSEALEVFNVGMPKLEDAMSQYLNFHKAG